MAFRSSLALFEAPKLFAVTMIRSPIGANPKVRATLRTLGLKKMNETVITKNSESIAGMLRRCIQHVDVKPVQFDADASSIGRLTPEQHLVGGKPVFIGHDGIVRGTTESDLAK